MFEDEHAGSGAQYSGTRNGDAIGRLMVASPNAPAAVKEDRLDGPEAQRLWTNMLGHFLRELDIQQDNRAEMERDEEYYDHIQWTDADSAVLRRRGQEPITYNVIKTTTDWVLGTERRSRGDYKILPRRKEGGKAAERKSQLLKYLSDVNRSPFHISQSFAQSVKSGLGWIESGVQDEDEGEPIYDRHEDWRNMLYDSAAIEMDGSDGRYQFRTKWTDADLAAAYFPKRRAVIDLAANGTTYDMGAALDSYGDLPMDAHEALLDSTGAHDGVDGFSASRRRVRLIEGWFRVPRPTKRLSGGDFSGEVFDPASQGHFDELMTGRAHIRHDVTMRMHVMVFTTAGPLWLSESPYRHNRFPFTPIWCFRRGKDRQPYGLIRGLRGMQDDINKRASKALAILSSNKVIMDRGAVDDIEDFEDEIARPDAIIIKNPGKYLEISADRELAAGHIDLMSRTISMIQQVSGVTDEAMGRTTNASSGRAIIARQEQGQLSTAIIFDNLRLARQIHGEKMLSLTEQFMTEQKSFRITNSRGTPDYVTINDGLPDNDIVRTKADFIISEDDFNATIRQAQTSELLELMTQLAPVAPQIVMTVLDLVVEGMDIAAREAIVKRIRQMTGQTDPDADPNNPDPEQMQIQQAKAAAAEMQARMQEAEIADKEATAAEKQARAQKATTDIKKTAVDIEKARAGLPDAELDTQRKALDLATEMMANRHAISVADQLLAEVGFNVGKLPPAPAAAAPLALPPPNAAPGITTRPGPAGPAGIPPGAPQPRPIPA